MGIFDGFVGFIILVSTLICGIIGILVYINKYIKKHLVSLNKKMDKRATENRLMFGTVCTLTEVSLLTLEYFDGKELNGEVDALRKTVNKNKAKQNKYLQGLINDDQSGLFDDEECVY